MIPKSIGTSMLPFIKDKKLTRIRVVRSFTQLGKTDTFTLTVERGDKLNKK